MKKQILFSLIFIFIRSLTPSLTFSMEQEDWNNRDKREEDSDSETTQNTNNNSPSNDNSRSSSMVKIIVNDGQSFAIPQSTACVSETLRDHLAMINQFKQDDQEVPEIGFSVFSSNDIQVILQYLNLLKDARARAESKTAIEQQLSDKLAQDTEFNNNFESKVQLLNSANFLQIPELKTAVAQLFAQYLTSAEGLQAFLTHPDLLTKLSQDEKYEIAKNISKHPVLIEFLKRYLEKNPISSKSLTLKHNRDAYAVAISPDGTKIASGSSDNTIKICDIKTGNCLQTLKDHNDMVYSIAFSPDGTKLVSGSKDNTIKVWDIADIHNLTCIATLERDYLASTGFSPNGTKLISRSRDNTQTWDIKKIYLLNTLSLEQLLLLICIMEAPKHGAPLDMNQFPHLQPHFDAFDPKIKTILMEEFGTSLKAGFSYMWNWGL